MNGFKGSANAAKRASQERILHFKDGISWHEYNQQFGTGSLREALFGGLNSAARTTGMMRVLGTNPQNMFKYLTDTIAEDISKSGRPAALADYMTKVRRINRTVMPQVDGSLNIRQRRLGQCVGGCTRLVAYEPAWWRGNLIV